MMKNTNEINPDSLILKLDNKDDLTIPERMLKGRCILLGDKHDYSLDDAKSCFESVLRDDGNNVEANLELGYYYFSIDENFEKSKLHFEKAFEISKNNYIDAIVASSKIYGEKKPKQGLMFMEQALCIESSELEILREELELEITIG